jgi:hypothetical protein
MWSKLQEGSSGGLNPQMFGKSYIAADFQLHTAHRAPKEIVKRSFEAQARYETIIRLS